MEIIYMLKKTYLDGAKHDYLGVRIEMASSRYLNVTDLGVRSIEEMHWKVKSRLEERANELELKYRNGSLAVQLAYEAGKRWTKLRPNFQNFEAKATRLADSRLYPFKRDLRLVK